MFYEEKYIEGLLMCRSSPDGEWQLVSHQVMSHRLAKAEATVRAVTSEVEGYHRDLDERKHGGAAQNRAFSAIESALGMTWVPGAMLKRG